MTNLPSLYARVVAKRPDLAVSMLHHKVDVWWYGGLALPPQHAAALILARWVDALPKYHVLANMGTNTRGGTWLVYEMGIGGDYTDPNRDESVTPIEALAAFYLESKP